MRQKILFTLIVFFMVLSGCQQKTQPNEIELYTNKTDIKVDLEGKDSPRKIKVALASVISPKASLSKYNYLLEYIGSKMGVSIEIIQKQTYQEVDNMLKAGEVDFAFICSLSYVIGLKDQYIVDVAAPVVSGKALYNSYTIVNQNSTYESLIDLEGKKFAYSDPYSYTGRLSILSQLNKMGKNPSQFFKNAYFTYSHDYSVKAVSLGIVDGATVDGVIFDQLLIDDPELSSKIRIIGIGEEAGTPPIVASKNVDMKTVEEFSSILFNLKTHTQGRQLLKDLAIDQYVPINRMDYEIIQKELYLLGETP